MIIIIISTMIIIWRYILKPKYISYLYGVDAIKLCVDDDGVPFLDEAMELCETHPCQSQYASILIFLNYLKKFINCNFFLIIL